jgi:hypothetical protein
MNRTSRRQRELVLALTFLLALSLGGAGAANAAQSVAKVRITGPECEAAVAASGQPAAKACVIVEETGAGNGSDGAQAAASCWVPPGYTHCGSSWVKSQSVLLLWSVTSTATWVRNSSTGKVSWQSVTCTQTATGYTVTITWCGHYHNGLPDTNFGANFDVAFVWEGSPVKVSHGHRSSVNGYTGSQCCLQGW